MMEKSAIWFVFLMWMGWMCPVQAQFNPDKVCRLSDGRLVFTLDSRWTAEQKRQVAKQYDLDSALMADAFSGRHVINDSGVVWTTKKIDNHRTELSKNQDYESNERGFGELIFLLDDGLVQVQEEMTRTSQPFGVNRMTRPNIVPLGGSRYRFFLPGSQSAKRVFIAGSFNGWSTMQNPMTKSDSGWVITLDLKEGKYLYKYIIDGRWTPDPFNRLKEYDGQGGSNSVWFCYNYQFTLNGFADARSVFLAGSFNGWNNRDLRMYRVNGKWRINLYLREGTHAYKFFVDGQWMTDPDNPVTRPDGRGNVNSFMSLGDTIYFSLKGFPKAEKIAVAGNFNAWNRGELFMEKVTGGWELPYVLAPGNYEYKFVVDGKWIIDPDNPNTTGSGDFTNSVLTVKPNYLFKLDQYPKAENVFVTGSFNGWSRAGYRMFRKNGAWIFPLFLIPGKYTYKFIVDGKYILDPGNDIWEENEYGTGNSVLWVNP